MVGEEVLVRPVWSDVGVGGHREGVGEEPPAHSEAVKPPERTVQHLHFTSLILKQLGWVG